MCDYRLSNINVDKTWFIDLDAVKSMVYYNTLLNSADVRVNITDFKEEFVIFLKFWGGGL